MTTLSKKMIGYALGRTVRASDRPLSTSMAAAGGNASVSDLAVKIVTSRQFRNRAGRTGAGAPRQDRAQRPDERRESARVDSREQVCMSMR